MALSEKDVFYALLDNHRVKLEDVCEKADMSYNRMLERLNQGALHEMSAVEMNKLASAIGVPYVEFADLIAQADAGEFPADYPRDRIFLRIVTDDYLEDEKIVMILSRDEVAIIENARAKAEKAVEKALRQQSE